jgi:hypothetical protein
MNILAQFERCAPPPPRQKAEELLVESYSNISTYPLMILLRRSLRSTIIRNKQVFDADMWRPGPK